MFVYINGLGDATESNQTIYKKNIIYSLPRYLSPETILSGGGPAADVWAFGIILLELCIGKLWTNLKPGPILRRILTLVHAGNSAERIAREHDSFDAYKVRLGYFTFLIQDLVCVKLNS